LAILFLSKASLHGQTSGLPDATDPVAGMGINIHFTDAKPGELEMLSKAGFRWIRMDLFWSGTEKSAGVYDFSGYDRLLNSLDKFHIRALFILDYANPLYDEGLAPHTDEGRAAFTKWAIAVVTHFKDRGVIWEIWNEPNGSWFWKPHVNVDDYAKLALAVSKGIHQATPNEQIVGPALSGTDLSFVDTLGKDGIFSYWSALTIHPYLRTGPETYGPVYRQARRIIEKYKPPGHAVQLICGESGYCCTWKGLDDTLQAQYLARLFLFNTMSGIPLTIWYDWHDDGIDPTNTEHHFGIVYYDLRDWDSGPYEPKPSYAAAKTYSSELAGYRFTKRMKSSSPDDFVLSFTQGTGECLVAWTSSPRPHKVIVHAPDGIYIVTNFDGTKQSEVASTSGVLILSIDGGPQYLKRE
jgi:hypothetical protein